MDFVLTTSHWLFTKLSSFAIDIVDGIRLIGVYIHSIESYTIEKTPMNNKSVN